MTSRNTRLSRFQRPLIISTLLPLLLLTLLPAGAQARSIRWWLPEELYAKADLVALVMPMEISNTGETSDIQLNAQSPRLPGQIKRALLEVQYVVKGVAGDSLEMQYTALARQQAGNVAEPPERIDMEPLGSYIVYLKRSPNESFYRGVLEGDFDDGQAVLKIAPAPKTGIGEQTPEEPASPGTPQTRQPPQTQPQQARQSQQPQPSRRPSHEAGMTTTNTPTTLQPAPDPPSTTATTNQPPASPQTQPARPDRDRSRGTLPAPAFPDDYQPQAPSSPNTENTPPAAGQPIIGRPVGDSDARQLTPDPAD